MNGITYGNGSPDVLGEHNALSLNDKKIDKLMNVTDHGVQGLARDSVVLAGTKLAGETSVHNRLADDFGSDGDAKDHPSELESPSQHIEVSNREDEGDDGGIGNGGGTCDG